MWRVPTSALSALSRTGRLTAIIFRDEARSEEGEALVGSYSSVIGRYSAMAKLTCPRDMVIFKLCWAAHVYHLVKSPNLPDIFPGMT